MFQPGSIRRIQVKNFVTYTHAEFYPGANLNMIIGPNGTGKSTMVAAIILGLGGSPKTVGRGSKVSEYVKHSCNEATIDIYLQGKEDNSFLKISRSFDRHERNVWSINNVKKNFKEVTEEIKTFNIQVDNLCQFLPQDRVQDFAKMNKQELLRATQLALCREDLVEKHEKLIECKNQHTDLTKTLERNEQKLVQAKESNSRLEVKVESFNKKKKYLKDIENIDRRMAWIRYEQMREELDEIKIDKNRATEVYEKHKSKAKPMEQEINAAKKNATQLQNNHTNIMKTKWDLEKALEDKYERQDSYKQSIQSVIQEMNVRLDEFGLRDSERNTLENKIQEMEGIQKKLLEKCKNDEHRQITSEVEQISSKRNRLEDKRDNLLSQKVHRQAELRMIQNELTRLENVKNQRLQKLHQMDKGVHQAVLWLRNNKHLFKGEICEPMMLEINILDTKDAIFLENIISKRDLLAFTCERKDDMNLLIHSLRNQQKLPINVLHSTSIYDQRNFQATIPIEQLRRYGFYAYVDSLFTAPSMILHYLHRSYGIHNIPVGDSKVDQFFEQVPDSIKLFFSDKTRYLVKFSTYTGAKSTRQNQIAPNNTLSISLDVIRLDSLKGQIQEKQESFSNIDAELRNYDSQLQQFMNRIKELQSEQKVISDLKHQMQTVGSRIIAMKKKVDQLKSANADRDSVKQEANDKIRKIVKDMVAYQKEVLVKFKSYQKLLIKSGISTEKVDLARNKLAYLENQFHETKRLCDEAEEVLNAIKEKYSNILGQAKGALQKAKDLSNGYTPGDAGFNIFREIYEKLSDDLKVLQTEKEQLSSKIHCLRIADDGELEEYEQREELIRKLSSDIDKGNTELNKMKTQMENLEDDWLKPLVELVTEINLKFSNAYKKMNCSAELAIWTGDSVTDSTDYSQYGLSVKVSYRNGEPLQELNSTTQSGGERAVATAAFMLSLQELTPVPFRCVDEINQGMDSNNERRIFDLLLDCTTRPNTSQYFLITPKLVPNLRYSKNMAIHIVHNGPFVTPDRKWYMSKLCNPQGVKVGV